MIHLIRIMIASALLFPVAGDTVLFDFPWDGTSEFITENATVIASGDGKILLRVDGNCPSLTVKTGKDHRITMRYWKIHCQHLPLIIKGS